MTANLRGGLVKSTTERTGHLWEAPHRDEISYREAIQIISVLCGKLNNRVVVTLDEMATAPEPRLARNATGILVQNLVR